MSVKKKRTIGPCRGVTWLYYVVLLWSRDFFLFLYLDPRFRPLLLKFVFWGYENQSRPPISQFRFKKSEICLSKKTHVAISSIGFLVISS